MFGRIKKLKKSIVVGSILFIGVCAYATNVTIFDEFVALSITPAIGGFQIELENSIEFTANMPYSNPIASSGTIKGNGNSLDGNNLWQGLLFDASLLMTANEYDIYILDGITLMNFSRKNETQKGGAIFAVGVSANDIRNSRTKINFMFGDVNVVKNKVELDGMEDEASQQGGGIFIAGTLSSSTVAKSGGIVMINFTATNVNISSNQIFTIGDYKFTGLAQQGGGIFVAGAMSVGMSKYGDKISSDGIVKIDFTSANVKINDNTINTIGQLAFSAVQQGGGFFVAGVNSAGGRAGSFTSPMDEDLSNISSSGTVEIQYYLSNVDIRNNAINAFAEPQIDSIRGWVQQGGGLFFAGAVSAGGHEAAFLLDNMNKSSSGTLKLQYYLSNVDISSNVINSITEGQMTIVAQQGGGLFITGVESVGTGVFETEHDGTRLNISSSGVVQINITSTSFKVRNNSIVNEAGYGSRVVQQGGGIFIVGGMSGVNYGRPDSISKNISSSGKVEINFTSASMNISSNILKSNLNGVVRQGGGIFIGGAVSEVAWDGINNSSGAMASIEIIRSSISINYNEAAQGGAVFMVGTIVAEDEYGASTAEYAIAKIKTENSEAFFIGNIATSLGGAIYIAGNDGLGASNGQAYLEFINSDIRFLNNKAESGNGGAIYMTSGASISFINSNIIFRGNKANGKDNDIYMQGDATIIFDLGKGNRAELYGGLESIGDNNVVRKKGKGDLILGGVTDFKGKMIIEEGRLKVKSPIISIEELELWDNAILSTDIYWGVGNINWANTIIVKQDIMMEYQEIEVNVVRNPQVIGSSIAFIYAPYESGGSKDIVAGRYGYKFQWSPQTGIMNGQQYNSIGYLIFRGAYMRRSFLANAISQVAKPIGIDSLYERMGTNDRVWFEMNVQGQTLKEDKDSIGDFQEQGFGARAGWDIYAGEDRQLGLYIRYGINSMEQERDTADMKDLELGLYGGAYQYENIRLKGNLSFGIEQFDTKSELDYFIGERPKTSFDTQKAKFDTQSIKIGGQAEYIIGIGYVEIKPFIGLQGGYVHNGEIQEEGGGVADLQISANHYERLEGLFGIGVGNGFEVNGFHPTFIWNFKIYGRYLMLGQKAEYEAKYYKDVANLDEKISMFGAKREVIRGGLALRGEYLINDRVSIYGNLDTNFSKNESEYNANLGIEYRFTKIKLRKNHWKAQEKAESKAQAQKMKKQIAQEKAIEKEKAKTKAKIEKKRTVKELEQIEEYETQEIFENSRLKRSFRLSIAQFEPNQIELKQEYKDLIKEVAQEIIAQGYERVIIVGYRDKSETNHYHANLSRQRAMIVADEFIRNAIEEGKIEYVGVEEKMPIAINNKTGQTRNKNRSADIFVENKD